MEDELMFEMEESLADMTASLYDDVLTARRAMHDTDRLWAQTTLGPAALKGDWSSYLIEEVCLGVSEAKLKSYLTGFGYVSVGARRWRYWHPGMYPDIVLAGEELHPDRDFCPDLFNHILRRKRMEGWARRNALRMTA